MHDSLLNVSRSVAKGLKHYRSLGLFVISCVYPGQVISLFIFYHVVTPTCFMVVEIPENFAGTFIGSIKPLKELGILMFTISRRKIITLIL